MLAAHEDSRGRYGARKIKAALYREDITANRRHIYRIMKDNGLNRAYGRKKLKDHPNRLNEVDPQNLVARSFGGRSPRTHVCRNLTNVRVTGG